MTRRKHDAQREVNRWMAFMVEDIEALTDEEVAQELADAYGSLERADAVAAQAYAGARRIVGAARLAQARGALERHPVRAEGRAITGAQAKSAVLRYWADHPGEQPVTLAARHGQGLSDDDALELYRSMVALGVVPEPSDGQ